MFILYKLILFTYLEIKNNTNNKDPELIFKSLSSTYETLSGTEVDKGANMKAGVYLKPGETQKVCSRYVVQTIPVEQ